MTKPFGERLIEAGLASGQTIEQARSYQKMTSHRLGDCLVELGLIQEIAILRFLAAELKTRFVSGEKLALAKIDASVLERVPVRMAEKENFFPLAVDLERRVISIVMAEPQNQALVKEIRLVTEMTEVIAYVSTRRSIQAAIKKYYYGDHSAFVAATAPLQPEAESRPRLDGSSPSGAMNAVPSPSRVTQLREALGAVRGTVSEGDFVETLNVLVGMLERARPDFRGHSAQVARQAQAIARGMGLAPREVGHIVTAAYLHELGKKPDAHFTLPLLDASLTVKAEAKRQARAPIKLFEAVHLPGGVNAILAQLYEAFDGSGVPHGVRGEEICAGARIIAVVDAYFDLTRNALNGHGRLMSKQEALSALHEQSGTLFDPRVVRLLEVLQSGEFLKRRVEQSGRQVFVADPDDAVRTNLAEALSKHGLIVQSVSKLDALVDAALANEADTLVVGLAYGVNDLVALLQFIRARPESGGLPMLILGEPPDATVKERLIQAGVSSFVPSPVVAQDAAALVRTAYLSHVEYGGVGHLVSGSFDELNATELIKLLGTSQKSGRLTIRNGALQGYVHFERGRAIYARLADKQGDAAVAPLLSMPQADFTFDPEKLLGHMPNVDLGFESLVSVLNKPV